MVKIAGLGNSASGLKQYLESKSSMFGGAMDILFNKSQVL